MRPLYPHYNDGSTFVPRGAPGSYALTNAEQAAWRDGWRDGWDSNQRSEPRATIDEYLGIAWLTGGAAEGHRYAGYLEGRADHSRMAYGGGTTWRSTMNTTQGVLASLTLG